MNYIKKLDHDLINKIAAGEVVDRPASVVKELVENAIDAQANQIAVEIIKGGSSLIVVQDNGQGMAKEDARLALERHTTSKIATLDDLFNIQTLGFRGEALASISSVCQFTLETKTKESPEGTKLTIVNGQLSIVSCGCPTGTKIIIEDLFYNVPARKKFLKSETTEYNHILEIMTNFALIYPSIYFKLTHNNKLILNFPQTTNWLERIKQVLGSDTAKELIPLDQKGTIELQGFIGKPQIARPNRQTQYIFINNRSINDFLIAKAVKEAFGSLLPRELYPTFILNIIMPFDLVDVNVHPRKAEVKFKNSQEIYINILQAVQKKLANNIGYQLNPDQTAPVKKFTIKSSNPGYNYQPTISYQPKFKNINSAPSQINQALEFSQQLLKADFTANQEIVAIGDWRLLGQIHNSYLLIEAPAGLLIIDQHAAAERILYEKFKKNYSNQKIKSQKLLLPFTLELSAKEVNILNDSLEFLQKMGFDIEIFGPNSFIINAVPQDLDKLDLKLTILGIISDLAANDWQQLTSLEAKKDLIIKYAACRTAIKFKDKLELKEQGNLLQDILMIINKINTCPHGRPFIMELTLEQLAKNFKRL
jgi:DNA mismatch repair protein MutL